MSNLTRQVLTILFTVAGVCVLLYGLWEIRSIVVFILISAVLAITGKPLVEMFCGDRWPWLKLNRNLAAGITLIIMISIIGGVLTAFIPALISELRILGKIDYAKVITEVQNEVRSWQEFLGQKSPVATETQNPNLSEGLAELIDFSNLSDTLAEFIGSLGFLLISVFSILFITFFFLRERDLFRNIVLALVPTKYEGQVLHVAPRVKRNLSRYFTGLIIQITIITTLISIGLNLIGFSNTIVIGFFTGVINVIPYLGPIIGMIFGLILGIATNFASNSPTDLLLLIFLIMTVFGSVQLIDNFLLQPLIFSTSINAHPLEIFLVISIVGTLVGIPGMIVAVPGYSVLRLLAVEFFPNVKFVKRLTQKSPENERD